MAETHPKRQRHEEITHETQAFEFEPVNSNPKRQKTYSNILSFLDEEEEEEEQEPNQDFSAILKSLQQELSSSESTATNPFTFDFDSLPYTDEEVAELAHQHTVSATSADCTHQICAGGAVGDEGVVSVMRHLLEASDAELGIPNSGDNIIASISEEDFPFGFSDGLWDLEDEAANYCTVLQPELFM